MGGMKGGRGGGGEGTEMRRRSGEDEGVQANREKLCRRQITGQDGSASYWKGAAAAAAATPGAENGRALRRTD